MNKIRVDFNSLGEHGMVRAHLRRADADLAVGEEVVASDPVEDMEYVATVHSIDADSGVVWLDVAWEDAAQGGVLAAAPIGPGTTGSTTQLRITAAPFSPYTDTSNAARGELQLAAAG